MKNKVFGMWLLSLLVISFAACSDDDPQPLTFYQDYYEVPIHGNRHIGLLSGSGKYTLEVENPQILSATTEDGWSGPKVMIAIYGHLTGETTLKVTDNVSKESQTLQIKVTCNYEYSVIGGYGKVHPAFEGITYFYMVNNKNRDIYFFARESFDKYGVEKLTTAAKGTYAFEIEDDEVYVTLTYPSDSNGRLTDADIAPTPHRFLATQSNEFILHKLNQNLNLGLYTSPWKGDKDLTVLELTEVGTEHKITFNFKYPGQFPEGILE